MLLFGVLLAEAKEASPTPCTNATSLIDFSYLEIVLHFDLLQLSWKLHTSTTNNKLALVRMNLEASKGTPGRSHKKNTSDWERYLDTLRNPLKKHHHECIRDSRPGPDAAVAAPATIAEGPSVQPRLRLWMAEKPPTATAAKDSYPALSTTISKPETRTNTSIS